MGLSSVLVVPQQPCSSKGLTTHSSSCLGKSPHCCPVPFLFASSVWTLTSWPQLLLEMPH